MAMKEDDLSCKMFLWLPLVKRAGCFAVKLAGLGYYGSIEGFLEEGLRSASLEFQEGKTVNGLIPRFIRHIFCQCRPFNAIIKACWIAFIASINVRD